MNAPTPALDRFLETVPPDQRPAYTALVLAELAKALENARREIDAPTLEARNSDSLDFYDTAVWSVRSITEVAFRLGFEAGRAATRN